MFVRGDIIVIYGGYIDSAGCKTSVEIATVVEVGRDELLVTLNKRSWSGPCKVHRALCEKIDGKFTGIKSAPTAVVGDLVLVYKYDVVKSDLVKKAGTVQAIEMKSSGCKLHVLLDGEIKKIPIEDCLIL